MSIRRLVQLINSQGPPPMRKSIAVRFGLETNNRVAQQEADAATMENQERAAPPAAKVAKAAKAS